MSDNSPNDGSARWVPGDNADPLPNALPVVVAHEPGKTDEMMGGDVTLQAGANSDGTRGPEIFIKSDGTFWLDGKEVDTDEGMRDALVFFGRWVRTIHDEAG